MRFRVLAVFAFLLASSGAIAAAQAPATQTTARLAPMAPVALFVDGVKVGSIEDFQLPKTQAVSVGSSRCSSCTVMLTY